jgi:hypothetical protein
MQGPDRRARGELSERLRLRQGEIEEVARARVRAIADPGEISDPAYAEGLAAATTAALEYGLAALGASEEQAPAVPVALIAQARFAARNGVGLDTVLRRYFAGYALLGDFLVAEAAELELPTVVLKRLMRVQAGAFDRLLVVISEEHARERRPASPSTERRRLDVVQRLLAGEPLDTAELRYPFEAHHLGLLCRGPKTEEFLRELAASADRVLLAVRPNPETLWAWFGGMRPSDAGELSELAARRAPAGAAIAIGESAKGLAGWRLTHRQAATALPIAVRGPEPTVRYADVALVAAALKDELLATSLRRLYLEPLESMRDGGAIARESLRAYFAAEHNVSSAAAMLGVSRTTLVGRLRAAEAAIGRTLSSCRSELEVALGLDEENRRFVHFSGHIGQADPAAR